MFQRQTMISEMVEMGLDPMAELRALGYEFRDGQLREVGGDSGFVFQGSSHYNSLAEAAAQYVPLLLEEEGHLNPLWLPLGVQSGEGCPIFVSEGYEKAERLLLVIQGAGRVRAGMWGCALCINDSLDRGTVLPFLRRAAAFGYGVIVFNPNENTVDDVPIPGSENFNNHVAYVMENVVLGQCAAAKIDVLAHSHGGRALLHYLSRAGGNHIATDLVKRLHRLAFTDSYHVQTQLAFLPSCVRSLLNDATRTVNFVPDRSPLGTRVREWTSQEYSFGEGDRGCVCLSAGVLDHASTNYAAMGAVFEFFEAGCQDAIPGPHNIKIDRMESFDGIDEANFSYPVFDNCENNNPVFNACDNPQFEADAEENSHMPASPSKGKKSPQWTRFKNLFRGAVSFKMSTAVRPYGNVKTAC